MFQIRVISTLLFLLVLGGCQGLDNRCSEYSNDPWAQTSCMARIGDKDAQYEMGARAFSKLDYTTAIYWFEKAAHSKPRSNTIHVPPVGEQQKSTVMRVGTGKSFSGNRDAMTMLANIYEFGLNGSVDINKANKYRRMLGLEVITD